MAADAAAVVVVAATATIARNPVISLVTAPRSVKNAEAVDTEAAVADMEVVAADIKVAVEDMVVAAVAMAEVNNELFSLIIMGRDFCRRRNKFRRRL